jgi:hypothetical protein
MRVNRAFLPPLLNLPEIFFLEVGAPHLVFIGDHFGGLMHDVVGSNPAFLTTRAPCPATLA